MRNYAMCILAPCAWHVHNRWQNVIYVNKPKLNIHVCPEQSLAMEGGYPMHWQIPQLYHHFPGLTRHML
jgi:hypothetical protein